MAHADTMLHIFSGAANVPLAEAVAARLDLRLGNRLLEHFPDGEVRIQVRESVRGGDVYMVQPTGPPSASISSSSSSSPTPVAAPGRSASPRSSRITAMPARIGASTPASR